jgi:RimJ/RimL family protein N-acetyltransferase
VPPFPRDPLPTADGLVLRPLARRDADELLRIRQDGETRRWSDPGGYVAADAAATVEWAARSWEEGKSAQLAIVAPDDEDTLLGTVGLTLYDATRGSIGYGIAEEARGRGVATAALRAVSRWAFDVFPDLVRLDLWIVPGNDASVRVAERVGYRREGVLRARFPFGGELSDVISFSLLRGELEP